MLTWSGGPEGRRREASEPEDKLDAASAVNRPRAVPMGWMTIDWPSRKGLLEPGAVKAARRGSEGAPAQQCAGATRPLSKSCAPRDGRRIVRRTARAASADSNFRPGPRLPTLRAHHIKIGEAGPEALPLPSLPIRHVSRSLGV